MPFQLINLSQRDPRWKNINLGFSNESTIGVQGAAITCLSMWVSGFGYTDTPDSLNKEFKKRGGFAQDELVWGTIGSLHSKVKYKSLYVCSGRDAPVAVISASISAGQPVILQVDNSLKPGFQTHWVVAYANSGDDFLILDPWPYPVEIGQAVSLKTRYGQGQSLKRAIRAALFLECQAAADGSVPILPPDLNDGSLYLRVRTQVPSGLRVRATPDTDSETLSFEYPGNYLKVTDPEISAVPKIGIYGQWLGVRNMIGIEGYVAAWYVDAVTSLPVSVGVRVHPSVGDGLENIDTSAPVEQRMVNTSNLTGSYQLVADIWNQYGGILSAMSSKLGIDPGIAVATLGVESGGQPFGPDGRLLIRFENHLFYYYWGKDNLEKFNKHFAFNLGQRWTGHKWRADARGTWSDVHSDQSHEWDVFNYAYTLNESAAMQSISMGMPQIMGFNYAVVGYASAKDMFIAFGRSEREQVIGFFDFVQSILPSEGAVMHLKSKNFVQFSLIYNGIGQASIYAGLIDSAYKAYRQLSAALPTKA